ncbi:MAG: nitroreductase [Muribaculaceae bacterium]|nr:nitroreductase [Muribaculaceae bacterium]
MTLLEAIQARHSVRRYHPGPLAPDVRQAIEAKVREVNATAGLHVQLICDEPRAFTGVFAYGKFSGVTNYLVMAGPKAPDLDERIGYYGEQLVLLAQQLGLNTCWAGLSYRKVDDTYTLADGEKICCYIALGYGLTQGSARKSKSAEQVSNVGPDSPQWFRDAIAAVLLAPTAINQQKFRFSYTGSGTCVIAHRLFSLVGYTQMDMGIAKLHFEIAAARPIEWIDK